MKIITTDYAKQIFWQEQELEASEIGSMKLVKLYPDVRRQEMKGFGGAFTEAAGYCYSKLPKEKQQEFVELYFGESGLKYNVGRTHINSCDFALGNYDAWTKEEKDPQRLDLSRANQYVLPLIRDALKITGDKLEILLSPWSPPADMKTNGEMNHGGRLKDERRGDWAEYSGGGADERDLSGKGDLFHGGLRRVQQIRRFGRSFPGGNVRS